ncbi:heme-dependent catalase [Aureobasidium pullulans]|nr:heme-dependent catalase [Aureobasidium pullulans]
MPLPEDKQLLKLSDELVETIRETFDTPKNYRPVHAKGQLVKGYFTPHKDASKLSKAPIFTQPSTPLIMRYSTDTGFKNLPDNGENGSRSFAIRFVLSEDGHTHYDIITNNAYGFVVSTGEGFLDQFKAMRDDKMEEFLDKYPYARYLMENQSPTHSYSFATEQWHSIHAYKFVNDEEKERYFRWRIGPWLGVMKHSKADAAKLMAQLAEEGDEVNDSTKVWPETNEFAEMGEIVIDRLWEMDGGEPAGREQKRIIYDPIPRYMEGVEVSEDPLLEVRTAVYLISGRIRREHIQEEVQQAVK